MTNEKTFLIFSLEDLFSNRWQNSDVRLRNAIQKYNRNIYTISELKSNVKIIDFLDFVKKVHGIPRFWNKKYYEPQRFQLFPKEVIVLKNKHFWNSVQMVILAFVTYLRNRYKLQRMSWSGKVEKLFCVSGTFYTLQVFIHSNSL